MDRTLEKPVAFLSPPPAEPHQLAAALAQLEPIALAEMEEVKLLARVDTKFLMTEEQFLAIVGAVEPHYRILTNQGVRASLYWTQYFDTPEYILYLDHHNDRRERYKVRSRCYVDSDAAFLEIKHKTKRSRTIKTRRQIPAMPDVLEGDNLAFVRAHYPHNPWRLEAVIWNTFHRITLVSKEQQERLTVDVGLRFGWGEAQGDLCGIAIAEVKQPKFSYESRFLQELRRYGIFRTGFSKYCAGMAHVYPQLKTNRFKRRDMLIDQLLRRRGLP